MRTRLKRALTKAQNNQTSASRLQSNLKCNFYSDFCRQDFFSTFTSGNKYP